MKNIDARSLVEALTGTWLNSTDRAARIESLRKPPPELLTLAQRARGRKPEWIASKQKDALEGCNEIVQYYNNIWADFQLCPV